VDNGCEFLSAERLERFSRSAERKRTTIYYAHPYSAYERGSNENQNKLIRRFVSKGTDIGQLKQQDVQRIQHWMNHYPRRLLGYDSLAERCTLGVLDLQAGLRQ
jgi:IS30 family transposase